MSKRKINKSLNEGRRKLQTAIAGRRAGKTSHMTDALIYGATMGYKTEPRDTSVPEFIEFEVKRLFHEKFAKKGMIPQVRNNDYTSSDVRGKGLFYDEITVDAKERSWGTLVVKVYFHWGPKDENSAVWRVEIDSEDPKIITKVLSNGIDSVFNPMPNTKAAKVFYGL